MTRRRIPTIELQADERALHEDFKRLHQLSGPRPLTGPLAATLRGKTGEALAATCIEVTNETLGLLLPADARPEVGEALDLIALRQGAEVLMQEVSCEVARVSPVVGDLESGNLGNGNLGNTGNTGNMRDLVFVSARLRPRAGRAAPALRITNPLRVRAVLEKASQGELGFGVTASAGSKPAQQLSGVVAGDSLYLTTASAQGWQPEQAVIVSFLFEGRPLFGFTKVRRALGEALVLALPQALLEEPRGIELRSRTFQDLGSVIFTSPLSGLRCTRKVLELSTNGLKFKPNAFDVLPPGLALRQLSLSLGAVHLEADAIVTGAGALEFTALPGRQQLLEVLLPARVQGVCCATQVRHAALRRLFREEGVSFRDHPEVPRSPLGAGAQGLGKSLALVRDGELIAHGGGLRIYSRTWLAHHLLVKSGLHRTGALSQQVMALSFEYGEALADVDFVRGLFKVSQGSAERIFSVISERVLRPGLGYRRRFEPMRIRAGALPEGPLEVREAGPDDERDFLSFVGGSEDPLKLVSDDLVPGELRLETLARRYAAQGLSRGRSLFVVQDPHGAPLGWSLVESMSEGLFWSELHSSFRLFVREPSGPLAAQARASLAAHAAALAARAGRAEAECHAGEGEVSELLALGFSSLGKVYEFGAHRSVVPELTQALGAVLARLRRREPKVWGDEALALQNC